MKKVELFFSYTDVFKTYYECANNKAISKGRKINLLRIRSSDENYILKGINNPDDSFFNPTITPISAIKKNIVYNDVTNNFGNGYFTYNNVQNGDILIETDTDFIQFNMGHAALIYDINKQAAGKVYNRNNRYIQTIEAVGGGVQFGLVDDQRMVDYGCVIMRPTSQSNYKIKKAKEFCLDQVGCEYEIPSESQIKLPHDKGNWPNREDRKWYCSELVYCAYKYAGTIVGKISQGYCMPQDILRYNGVKYIAFSSTLDVRLLGKVNGKWNYRVFNYTGHSITLEYNTKLCFANDAISWKGLKNINKSITTSNGSYSDSVMIVTNFFATTAAMSYTYNGKRYITYANELNADLLRPTIRKNIIRL